MERWRDVGRSGGRVPGPRSVGLALIVFVILASILSLLVNGNGFIPLSIASNRVLLVVLGVAVLLALLEA